MFHEIQFQYKTYKYKSINFKIQYITKHYFIICRKCKRNVKKFIVYHLHHRFKFPT